MNKKLLSCLTAFALILTLAFSAGAACSRAFVADVILPPDGDFYTSSVYEPESVTTFAAEPDTGDAIERIDISDEFASNIAQQAEETAYADAEDETVILYGAAEVPPAYTLPDVETDAQPASVVKPVLICLVIGAVIALIVVLSVKSSYKPVRRRRDAAEYLVDGSLNVTASDETLVRTERSERKIQTKDSDE